MGIKDNFSQAVKELWKKDGLEENGENKTDRSAQPTELDKYLSEGAQQPAPQQAPAQPEQPVQPAQPAQPSQAAQNAQGVQQPRSDNGYQFSGGQQGAADNAGVPLETPYYRQQTQNNAGTAYPGAAEAQNSGFAGNNNAGFGGNNFGGGNGGSGGYVPPSSAGRSVDAPSDTDEVTVISRNTIIDGNVRSLANMQVDGNIKGNVETTRDIEMSGKVVGDIKCNNANMNSAAMQGNLNLKGKIRMDRDTILIGDLTSQYADVNGRIRGKLEIGGKAELKRDAIVFGDINASTIAVTDGAIIQGYVNTTFLSKEDSRSVFPEAISFDSKNTADKA